MTSEHTAELHTKTMTTDGGEFSFDIDGSPAGTVFSHEDFPCCTEDSDCEDADAYASQVLSRIDSCWNAMQGISDPADAMAKVREALQAFINAQDARDDGMQGAGRLLEQAEALAREALALAAKQIGGSE